MSAHLPNVAALPDDALAQLAAAVADEQAHRIQHRRRLENERQRVVLRHAESDHGRMHQ